MKTAAVLIALWCPASALAQQVASAPWPRAEIFGSWTVPLAAAGGTVEATYAPPLRLGGTPIESRSSQVLTVDLGVGRGVEAGANVFVHRVVGVQAAFTWSRASVSGTNQNYDVYLRYIARQPPDYVPREYTYQRSSPWAATSGRLQETSVALGAVARWRASQGGVGGTVAGGLNVDAYSGSLESLAYTQFILGGHSTLFPVRHRVVMAPAKGQRFWGPYVGADLDVGVGAHLALFGGVRVVFGPRRVITTEAERLVDPSEDTWTPALADVQADLDGQSLELPGIRWRLVIGAKVRVG